MTREEFILAVAAREGEAAKMLSLKRVAIFGLGGLGSRVAELLVRSGVGDLVLIDKDYVEPTNLGRQRYDACDIGKLKTEATKSALLRICPGLNLTCHAVTVTKENAVDLAFGAQVVVEAFDDAKVKAALVNTILECTDKTVVSASGIGGLPLVSAFSLRHMDRLYLCGTGKDAPYLFAPAVSLAASQQAICTLRALGVDE